MNQKKSEQLFIKISLVIGVILFLGFGIFHLNEFLTADEHYWINERIPEYWKSLNERKVKNTLINDKPGVTLVFTSGWGLFFDKNPQDAVTKIDDYLSIYDTLRIKKQLLTFRLPILILNASLLIFFFYLIKNNISDDWVALWTTLFIALSPILLGISQIINPDSLLWSFFFGSILSYFSFLKFGEKKYLLLTVLFTSLSLATKYVANILFPLFLLMLIFNLLFNFKGDLKKLKSNSLKQLFHYYLIVIGSAFLLIILIPAILVKPIYLYRLTLGFSEMKNIAKLIFVITFLIFADAIFLKSKLLQLSKIIFSKIEPVFKIIPLILILIFSTLILGRLFFPDWELFEKIAFDIKDLSNIKYSGYSANYFEKILLEFNPLVFSLAPVALILLLALWIKWMILGNKKYFFEIVLLSLFIIIFIIASIKSNTLNTVRYSIILFPITFFLSALGLNDLLETNNQRIIATIFIIIILLGTLWNVKPFYFNYTNILLPQDKLISDAWGYGGYEAAQYLNGIKDAKNKIIWSDYYGVCEFFKGKCITKYQFDENQYPIDYYVLTRRGEIRYKPEDPKWRENGYVSAYKYYSKKDPIWQLLIHGREKNYIKIFISD